MATIQLLEGGGGGGVFVLHKLFISFPACNSVFISHSASSKLFLSLSWMFSVYKVGSRTGLSRLGPIDVGIRETSEVYYSPANKENSPNVVSMLGQPRRQPCLLRRLHKLKCHLMMPTEAMHFLKGH